jgi:choice-of-anchor A domain-containing protein
VVAVSLGCPGEIHLFPPATPPNPKVATCPPCPVGDPLPPFAAFAVGDITNKDSVNLGTMAAGGNINLAAYSINSHTPFNGTCETALVAGGSIFYVNGQVRGNVYAGATASLIDVTLPTGCEPAQNVGRDTVVNFDAAAKNLLVQPCQCSLF